MKPFDLEKALAGAPVVTRIGEEVTQVVFFNASTTFPVRAVIDGTIYSYTTAGAYLSGAYNQHVRTILSGGNDLDLFMAPVKKVAYINVYRPNHDSTDSTDRTQGLGVVLGTKIHATKEAANANASGAPPRIALATLEYEE